MGACDFVWAHRTEKPVKMNQAFKDAVANAQYEYGHRGYTGSLAEKHSVVFIAKVKTETEAYELASKLIGDGDGRIDDKWGPAGAIEFEKSNKNEEYPTGWVFFGMAAS